MVHDHYLLLWSRKHLFSSNITVTNELHYLYFCVRDIVLFDLQVASHMKCAGGMHTVIM